MMFASSKNSESRPSEVLRRMSGAIKTTGPALKFKLEPVSSLDRRDTDSPNKWKTENSPSSKGQRGHLEQDQEDQGLDPFKKVHGQFLNVPLKAARLKKNRKMKAEVRGRRFQNILFSGEQIFTVEPLQNTQDHCERLPKGSPRTVTVEKSHFANSIMVWAVVSGLGNLELVFFKVNRKKVTYHGENYQKTGFWTAW
ncbi:hypothetical protein QR680_018906 [Steinernema hermaphroditum]|uniref:Uncharacterized protein n=1 Tax=Steinernema hermaphroditum TaxID=289476 RepID=A0AA39HKC9_9BILA|nr:hypothetical protein QR680_018906 [Steinernema hermaphroditum]